MLPIFERQGECNRFCGQCCNLAHWQEHPQYESVRSILESPPFIGMNARGECNHLTWEQGRATCGIYDTRPEICRTFPSHPLSLETIAACGYRFVEGVGQ